MHTSQMIHSKFVIYSQDVNEGERCLVREGLPATTHIHKLSSALKGGGEFRNLRSQGGHISVRDRRFYPPSYEF